MTIGKKIAGAFGLTVVVVFVGVVDVEAYWSTKSRVFQAFPPLNTTPTPT